MKASKYVNDLKKQIKESYGDIDKFISGILVADAEQRETKEYIMNYMNMFDKKSGKYIDFFIPGYYTDNDKEKTELRRKYHPNGYVRDRNFPHPRVYWLDRSFSSYYFDRDAFESFLRFMSNELGIQYTYNPMLIMLEVDTTNCRGELSFQKKLVIELDEDSNRGLRRTGMLFDKIFEFAKSNVSLSSFGSEVRVYYLKGAAVDRLIDVLNGDFIQAMAETVKDVFRFRIIWIEKLVSDYNIDKNTGNEFSRYYEIINLPFYIVNSPWLNWYISR